MLALYDKHGKVRFSSVFSNEEIMQIEVGNGSHACNILDFSENGFHLLVGHKGSKQVSIVDLRPNYQKVVKELDFESEVESACYDKTGRYILAACGDLHLFEAIKFGQLMTFKEKDSMPAVSKAM